MRAIEEDVAAIGAAVEKQIDEPEMRNEPALGVALRIHRVREALPDQADACAAHLLVVEIARRAAASGEIRAREEEFVSSLFGLILLAFPLLMNRATTSSHPRAFSGPNRPGQLLFEVIFGVHKKGALIESFLSP